MINVAVSASQNSAADKVENGMMMMMRRTMKTRLQTVFSTIQQSAITETVRSRLPKKLNGLGVNFLDAKSGSTKCV